MNCNNCDYPLWNIRNRQCPECGAAFAPSDFDFIPNSVCFCCPHCDQSYYGIGNRGHLEPRRFECAKCHQPIDMDEMVLRPAPGVEHRATRLDRMPWFERNERGMIKAWFATMNAAMSRPSSLIRAVPREHSMGAAWMFMFLSNIIFMIVGSGIPLLLTLVIFKIISTQISGMAGVMPMIFQQTVWQLPFQFVLLAIAPPIWAWLAHLFLLMGGSPAEKFSRTAHCVYYSSASNVLSAIPCGNCSQLAGKVWWVVSAILMVKESQRVSGGRATFAVLTSAIIIGLAITVGAIGVSFLFMGFPGGSFANFGASVGAGFVAPTIWTDLSTYSAQHNGDGPRHAIELLGEDELNQSFMTFVVTSDESRVPVGNTNLKQLMAMAPEAKLEVIKKVAADQPQNVIAHRLGDVVFTYHGIDFNSRDSRLWAFIMSPDPVLSSAMSQMPLTIVRIDGSTYQVDIGKFPAELQAQNGFRQQLGLSALPANVLAIRHGSPAVAAATDEDQKSPVPNPEEIDDDSMNE